MALKTRAMGLVLVGALLSVAGSVAATHDTDNMAQENVPCIDISHTETMMTLGEEIAFSECDQMDPPSDWVSNNVSPLVKDLVSAVQTQVDGASAAVQDQTQGDHLRVNRNWHPPIRIDDETDFHEANGVRGGTGTADDPYVISNWTITPMDGDPAIRISGTDEHVVIQEVTIRPLNRSDSAQEYAAEKVSSSQGLDGVVLRDSENVTFRDSVIRETGFGILLDETHHTVIAQNRIEETADNPIRSSKGSALAIRGNDLQPRPRETFDGAGIRVRGTHHVTIVHNQMVGQAEAGVRLERASNVIIAENTIDGSGHTGIDLVGGSDVRVVRNVLQDIPQIGIWVTSTTDVVVNYNNLQRIGGHALDSDTPVNATDNWWGCSDGPEHWSHDQIDPDCESVSGYAAHDEAHHPFLEHPVADAGSDPGSADGSDDSYVPPDELAGDVTGSSDADDPVTDSTSTDDSGTLDDTTTSTTTSTSDDDTSTSTSTDDDTDLSGATLDTSLS